LLIHHFNVGPTTSRNSMRICISAFILPMTISKGYSWGRMI
jgi:hypothetical protein